MARYPRDTTLKLTNELIETIAQAIRVGAYVETAVALAGVSKDSFYRWLRQADSDDSTRRGRRTIAKDIRLHAHPRTIKGLV